MAIISNLLRLIAKPIFLKLGKGLKSSKTQYCLGDEIDIRLDDSIIALLKNPLPTTSGGTGLNQLGQIGQVLGIDSNGKLAYIDVSGTGTKKVVAATARFPTGEIPWLTNAPYDIGGVGGISAIKVRDQDGDNFQANNLIIGDGTAQNYLRYIVPYSGLWATSYQFTFEVNNTDKPTFIDSRLRWGKSYENSLFLAEFDNFSSDARRKSVVGTKIMPLEKGDQVWVQVNVKREPSDPSLTAKMATFWNPPGFDSYIGFGLIEEGNVTIPTL